MHGVWDVMVNYSFQLDSLGPMPAAPRVWAGSAEVGQPSSCFDSNRLQMAIKSRKENTAESKASPWWSGHDAFTTSISSRGIGIEDPALSLQQNLPCGRMIPTALKISVVGKYLHGLNNIVWLRWEVGSCHTAFYFHTKAVFSKIGPSPRLSISYQCGVSSEVAAPTQDLGGLSAI